MSFCWLRHTRLLCLRNLNLELQIRAHPSEDFLDALAAGEASNPFCTRQYAAARAALGDEIYEIAIRHPDQLISPCLGFIDGRFFKRRLRIASLPSLPYQDIFWDGITRFCRNSAIWLLQIESYCSSSATIPLLGQEMKRRRRMEYILELQQNLTAGLSSMHRRNISRAKKAGLIVGRSSDPSVCSDHMDLMMASLTRRLRRGEVVEVGYDRAVFTALLSTGSAEIFRALQNSTVLSSILTLRSKKGAYYQSAGTTPQGMEMGASPFLIMSVAEILRGEGATKFNLGGAEPENLGLQRFKAGFGAREVSLEAACFCTRSRVACNLRRGMLWLRSKAL